MSRTPLKIAAALVVVFVALPAIAGEGRIPIYQYPTVIGAPGKYIVTRDIRGGGLPVIDINSHNVDLDINGFNLEETTGAAPVIAITGDLVDVVIRNGNLIGGSNSIDRGFGAAQEGDRVVIEDVQTKYAAQASIHLWGLREVVIRRANIISPGGHGIWLERAGIGGFTNGMIEHCAIRLDETSQDGIHLQNSSSFAVRHNRIETPPNDGIHVVESYATLVGENTISDADVHGIHFENSLGGKIYNNVVSRGELFGVFIDGPSGQVLVLDNVVRQSGWNGAPAPGFGGGHGYVIDGNLNKLEGNTAIENDACGFLFNGPDNTFGNNMARLNDPAGIGWCNAMQAGGPCAALPAPDYCDIIGPGSGNDSRGDNMAATGLLPF
jgi:parallel beta-helix repeat protein